ncbi:MAG: hypothetical protein Q7J29_02430 [Stagnimonas sp.]|nr:hypothetical protein [Stagnimonas sp.]
MSPEALTVLLLIAVALCAAALWHGRKVAAQLAQLEGDLHRAEVAGREQAAQIKALETLRDTQQLTEHAIATGTAVVREMHRGIADIPFSVFEAIPATRAPAKALRGLHDSISEGVYGALAGLNKAVGRELRKGTTLPDAVTVKSAAIEAPDLEALPPAAPEPQAPEEPPAKPPSRGWG